LKVGDHVTAYDPTTGKQTTQTVERVFLNHDHDRLDVTLASQTSAIAAAASVVAARNAGRVARAGQGRPVATATRQTTRDEVIHTTSSHPWLTVDEGWLRAGQLHLGEPVRLLDGATATVVALRVVPGVGAMWDISLDSVHTFAVGDVQAVVHNCGVSTNDLGRSREQYVAANLDTIAPAANQPPVEVLDPNDPANKINFGTGSYTPDIRTGNSIIEVGGPGKYRNLDASIGQFTRLAKAAKFEGTSAYYAWDVTSGVQMPQQFVKLAGKWNVNIVTFIMP
jgi:hypothetical protein